MKMYSTVKYLSSETKVSAKGKQYKLSSFVQVGSVGVLVCVDTTDLNLDFGEEIQAIFNYNPKYQSITFIGIIEE